MFILKKKIQKHIDKVVEKEKKKQEKIKQIEIFQLQKQHDAKITRLEKESEQKLKLQSDVHIEKTKTTTAMYKAELNSLERTNKELLKKIHSIQDIYQEYKTKLHQTKLTFEQLAELSQNLIQTNAEASQRIFKLRNDLNMEFLKEEKKEERIEQELY